MKNIIQTERFREWLEYEIAKEVSLRNDFLKDGTRYNALVACRHAPDESIIQEYLNYEHEKEKQYA